MGDRRQVIIKERDEADIYIYVHWHGYNLPDIVKEAVTNAKPRWSDTSYCRRIIMHTIFDAVTDPESDCGCGVSTHELDTEYPGQDVVIDLDKRHITVGSICMLFENFIKYGIKQEDEIN